MQAYRNVEVSSVSWHGLCCFARCPGVGDGCGNLGTVCRPPPHLGKAAAPSWPRLSHPMTSWLVAQASPSSKIPWWMEVQGWPDVVKGHMPPSGVTHCHSHLAESLPWPVTAVLCSVLSRGSWHFRSHPSPFPRQEACRDRSNFLFQLETPWD